MPLRGNEFPVPACESRLLRCSSVADVRCCEARVIKVAKVKRRIGLSIQVVSYSEED